MAKSKRVPDNKSANCVLRLTPDELEAWKRAAAAEDRSLSNWIRRTCNAAAAGE